MATCTWMWGDASIVGQYAAQMNPCRWSSAETIKATLEDLEGDETLDAHRPVLMSFTDSVSTWERLYQNVADAIEGLKEECRCRRLKDYQKPMRHLEENIAQLIAKIDQEGSSLEDAKNMLVDYRKIAFNRREDLLVYMSALNGPSRLFLGGREKRKAALACLNAFLDEVDAVKLDLVAFEKILNVKLQDAELAKESAAIASVGTQLDSPKSLDCTDSQVEKQVQLQDVPRRLEDHNELL